MQRVLSRSFASALLVLLAPFASAQSLPVQVDVSGNVATIVVGAATNPVADVTLTFDAPSGLSATNLGVRAELVSATDPALLARLPGTLASIDASFPMMLTVEPPPGGLSFQRIVKVEIHTHALPYTYGSSYRLFKSPLGGAFRDITTEIAQGSVRARGTTDGFSQFLVLTDVRRSDDVVAEKLERLRSRIATLPADEATPLESLRAAAAASVSDARYEDALMQLDQLAARVSLRAGVGIPQVWTAGGGSNNTAGALLAGVGTAKFSIAYLRNFGR